MEYVNLGDVATYINGYAFKPEQRGKKGLPIIRIQDLNGNSHDLGFFEGEYPEQVEINTGDILISWSGSLGVYKWNKGKALLNQHIFKVQFNKIKIDKEYFCYAIRNSFSAMSQQTHGATMKHITKKDFDNILIPYPDLNVQRQIANNLETVNELIESYEKELILLEQLVKARFIEMFGDPEENPFNWEKILLAKVIINANNGMARRGNDKDGNIVMRLVELQDGYIDYSNPNRIILKDNEKKRYLLKDEDFLFARVNGNPDNVGRCAVFHDIGEDVYHNDHIIRVHFDEELLNGTFASALFNSDYGKKQLKSKIKTSAGQYTVSQDGIGAIATILPPAKLQNQFADFVQQVDKSKLAVQQSLEKMQQLFDSLMQEYFG